MNDERKDEIIAALGELIQELTNKLVSVRVDAGLKLKAKDAEIAKLQVEIAKLKGETGV
jgi:hypothetical protein